MYFLCQLFKIEFFLNDICLFYFFNGNIQKNVYRCRFIYLFYFQTSYKKEAADTAPHKLTRMGLNVMNFELFVATTRSHILRKYLNPRFFLAAKK